MAVVIAVEVAMAAEIGPGVSLEPFWPGVYVGEAEVW